MQRRIHQHLVEGPVEERRIDRDDWVQTRQRHPGRAGDRMLFGDAYVESPLREGRREPVEARGVEHGGSNRDDVIALRTQSHELLAEDVRPDRRSAGQQLAGLRVERPTHGVQVVLVVLFCRRVTESLLREHVHNDRTAEVLGQLERLLDCRLVVSVDRPDVLEPQVLEHALGSQRVLEPLLDRMQHVIERGSYELGPLQATPDVRKHLFVAGIRAETGQVLGEPPHRGGVGAAVVVDDDDKLAVLRRRDVVEGLPRHSARQSAVAHHRDDVAVLAFDDVRLGQAVGVRQGRGGVGVLDDVVRRLRLARVAGQPTLLAELRELVGSSGEHLVHVCLVPGVEDDPVMRRVEDPVDGQRQLDHAQVGTEVTSGLGHPIDQERADLAGELA